MTVVTATGAYSYVPSRHYVGARHDHGLHPRERDRGGGEAAATAYLQYLARHPSTAHHIAYKLAQRFVADDPPADLVSSLAQTYLANDTRDRPGAAAAVHQRGVRASAGPKVRTPFEDVVATVRLLGIGPDADGGVVGIKALFSIDVQRRAGAAGLAGAQRLSATSPARGPPRRAPSPGGTCTTRWRAAASTALAHPARASFLPSPLPTTHGALIDALCDRLLLPRRNTEQRAALVHLRQRASRTTALTATSQAATSRLPHLIALLLDSPDFFLR